MKQIIKLIKKIPTGEMVIDRNDTDFMYLTDAEIYGNRLPYTSLYTRIILRNYNSIPAELITRLTNQYLHGAEIVFENTYKGFNKSYKLSNPKDIISYQWTPFSLSNPIPKSLATFRLKYNNKDMSYLDAVKTLNNTRYIPNEIWNAIDKYSQAQIDKCKKYNKGNYALAEEWYKQLMRDCIHNNIKMYSPNKKTYYEAIAEDNFNYAVESLKHGFTPLTPDEEVFLRRYAPAYGVEIPKFTYRINSRLTPHGYTAEPECIRGMTDSDWDVVIFDPRKENNLPKNIRKDMVAKSYDNPKLLREAYEHLMYIINNLQDAGLMPGWARCPECGEIYRESEGCECGACQPITYVQANNLFYGTASEYEDYEYTKDIYGDMDYEDDWD